MGFNSLASLSNNMANREVASPSIAPDSRQNESSFLKNKFLWGGLVIFSLVAFVGALVYFCMKRRVFANSKRRLKKKKG